VLGADDVRSASTEAALTTGPGARDLTVVLGLLLLLLEHFVEEFLNPLLLRIGERKLGVRRLRSNFIGNKTTYTIS